MWEGTLILDHWNFLPSLLVSEVKILDVCNMYEVCSVLFYDVTISLCFQISFKHIFFTMKIGAEG